MRSPKKYFKQTIDDEITLKSNQLASLIETYDEDEIIKLLIGYVLYELDEFEVDSIDSIKIALNYMLNIIQTRNVDRGIASKGTKSMSQKIDDIIDEGLDKLSNPEEDVESLIELQKEIDDIYYEKDNDPVTFGLLSSIIDIKNIEALNFVLYHYPKIVNIKDAEGVSIYRHIVRKTIDSISKLDEKEIRYYSKVLDIFTNVEAFYLSDKENGNILNELLDYLNDVGLERGRKRKKKIEHVDRLKTKIEEPDIKKYTPEELCEKYNIEPEFPEEFEYIDRINLPGYDQSRKKNEDYTISIDKKNGVIEDALSCTKLPNNKYLLKVHIADPLGYYDYYSSIITEAINRVETIFLKNKKTINDKEYNTIHMLPEFFIYSIANLRSEKDRLTRTYSFEVGEDVKYLGMEKTITRVDKNMTYKEAARIIEEEIEDNELKETMYNLKNAINIVDKKYQFTRRKNIRSIKTPAFWERVVEVTQNLVNYQFGRTSYENNYPCVYTVFEKDGKTNEALERLLKELESTYGSIKRKVPYDSICHHTYLSRDGIHENLGGIHYGRVTAPLRESEGIMNNRSQDLYLYPSTDEEKERFEQELDEYIEMANQKKEDIKTFIQEMPKTRAKRKTKKK